MHIVHYLLSDASLSNWYHISSRHILMDVNIILRNMFMQFVKWTFVISENTHNAECNLDITLPYLYSVIIACKAQRLNIYRFSSQSLCGYWICLIFYHICAFCFSVPNWTWWRLILAFTICWNSLVCPSCEKKTLKFASLSHWEWENWKWGCGCKINNNVSYHNSKVLFSMVFLLISSCFLVMISLHIKILGSESFTRHQQLVPTIEAALIFE